MFPKNLGAIDSIQHFGLAEATQVRTDYRIADIGEDFDQRIESIFPNRVVENVEAGDSTHSQLVQKKLRRHACVDPRPAVKIEQLGYSNVKEVRRESAQQSQVLAVLVRLLNEVHQIAYRSCYAVVVGAVFSEPVDEHWKSGDAIEKVGNRRFISEVDANEVGFSAHRVSAGR